MARAALAEIALGTKDFVQLNILPGARFSDTRSTEMLVAQAKILQKAHRLVAL